MTIYDRLHNAMISFSHAPWSITRSDDNAANITGIASDGVPHHGGYGRPPGWEYGSICTFFPDHVDRKFDAQLISASPELYTACLLWTAFRKNQKLVVCDILLDLGWNSHDGWASAEKFIQDYTEKAMLKAAGIETKEKRG